MLTIQTVIFFAVAAMSVVALVLSWIAVARATASLKAVETLVPFKDRFDSLDEGLVRSVMEEGGDASVEAVLETVERLMEMDDGSVGAAEALRQSREMHKR